MDINNLLEKSIKENLENKRISIHNNSVGINEIIPYRNDSLSDLIDYIDVNYAISRY